MFGTFHIRHLTSRTQRYAFSCERREEERCFSYNTTAPLRLAILSRLHRYLRLTQNNNNLRAKTDEYSGTILHEHPPSSL